MAAPRAYWKGHLRFSLISIPVKLFSATNSSAKIALNQIHKPTMQRIKMKTFAGDQEVARSELVKGYEYEKQKYVIIEPEELEKISIETTKTIDIVQFFETDELDPIHFNSHYYLAPDGPVAQEPFSVIRNAMEASGRMALCRVVLTGKEHLVAMSGHDKGFRMTTLRYVDEIRKADSYFEDIETSDGDEAQVTMAQTLIEQLTKPLDLSLFQDRYQTALLDLIKAKIDGSAPVVVQEEQVAQTFNFMDALRESVSATAGDAAATTSEAEPEETPAKAKKTPRKPAAKSIKKKAAARKTKKKA